MDDSNKWPDEVVYALGTTQRHHVQLSVMADNKANMLIGATFVVFTLAIGQSQAGNMSLPLLILAISAFGAAGLAALAVMPSVTPPKDSPDNMLFFGSFSKLSEGEFIERLLDKELLSQESTYRSMLRDIHQMGVVLAQKKYRYLGFAYRVFLLGLSLTLITYLIEQFSGPLI